MLAALLGKTVLGFSMKTIVMAVVSLIIVTTISGGYIYVTSLQNKLVLTSSKLAEEQLIRQSVEAAMMQVQIDLENSNKAIDELRLVNDATAKTWDDLMRDVLLTPSELTPSQDKKNEPISSLNRRSSNLNRVLEQASRRPVVPGKK